MGIQARSLLQQRFESGLRRSNPRKIRLVRAKPFDCGPGVPNSTCRGNGRKGIDSNCIACGGTGYVGGNQAEDDTLPRYATTYHIFGDVQVGHGLYGAGGDYLAMIADIGRQEVGDATLFCKMKEFDPTTKQYVWPIIDDNNPRPDRIFTARGEEFNVVREIIAEIGASLICRIMSLNKGGYSPASTVGGSR